MNFNFINKYRKVLIIEPYYGNVLERRIKKRINNHINLRSVSYQETIIHKYGNKVEQDKFLKFDNKSILRKVNEYFK